MARPSQKPTADKGGRWYQEFSAWELWDFVSRAPKPAPYLSTIADGPSGFNGETTWEEALNLARNGWPEGLAKVRKLSARVGEVLADTMPEERITHDVVGHFPDIGAYLAGEPENMIAYETVQGTAPKVVRILVNCAASAAVSTKAIEARGAMACALIDALENAGYRCEVVAALESYIMLGPGVRYSIGARVMLKRAEEALCMDRLVFALVHPAFLRRIGFRLTELCPDTAARDSFIRGAYGRTGTVVGGPGDIVIGEMDDADWTPERVAEEVRRYLAEVGVQVSA